MTEDKYMPQVREVWAMRMKSLGLKRGSKGRTAQLEAYLQGALALATATGVMTLDRANQIAFLVAIDRAEDFLEIKK